jgi:putative DNA primase/helicase
LVGEEEATFGNISNKVDQIVEWASCGEAGDAQFFIHLYRGRLAYDHAGGVWYAFQGHYWKLCELNEPLDIVGGLADRYLKVSKQFAIRRRNAARAGNEKGNQEAARIENLLLRKVILLQRRNYRQNVLALAAAGENSLGIGGGEWDQNPLLLGCRNGVLNLESGEFRDGQPGDFILKHCPTDWRGLETPAPGWENFVKEVMDDPERVPFLKRLLGSAISGEIIDHVFPIFWGAGRNGKSVLMEILVEVLGPLAGPVPAEMLMAQKHPRSAAAPSPDVMAFRGLRLAWASESDEGRRFNSGKIKWLSGGDTLTGRGPYDRRLVIFKPTHTLFLLTNFRPLGNAQDEAFWARVLSVRFPLSFVDSPSKPHERLRNPNLRNELREEASGILAWLLSGYLEWCEKGLLPPPSILSETDSYRRADDSIAHFLQEKCSLGKNYESRAQELFDAYTEYCEETGFKAKGKKTFFQRLKEDFEKKERKEGNYYCGLQIKT